MKGLWYASESSLDDKNWEICGVVGDVGDVGVVGAEGIEPLEAVLGRDASAG